MPMPRPPVSSQIVRRNVASGPHPTSTTSPPTSPWRSIHSRASSSVNARLVGEHAWVSTQRGEYSTRLVVVIRIEDEPAHVARDEPKGSARDRERLGLARREERSVHRQRGPVENRDEGGRAAGPAGVSGRSRCHPCGTAASRAESESRVTLAVASTSGPGG